MGLRDEIMRKFMTKDHKPISNDTHYHRIVGQLTLIIGDVEKETVAAVKSNRFGRGIKENVQY